MADEEKAFELPPVTELLGEETTPEPEVKKEEPTEHEVRAMEKGWVPKAEWKGNPEDWRPAKDYLDRGELIGKIMAQGKQLDELRQAVSYLSEKEKKQYVAGFNKAIEEMKARRNEALSEGDVVEAAKFDDKLDELKEQAREAKQAVQATNVAPPPSPDFLSWADRNKWYTGQNPESAYADRIGWEFKEKNRGSSEAEMLEAVEKAVRKKFPEVFPGMRAAPEPDGQGRMPRDNSGKQSYSNVEANMSQMERTIMKTVLQTSPGLTKEQYLKDYAEALRR